MGKATATERYRAARNAWFAHLHVCRECCEAHDAREPIDCKVGDELVSRQDNFAIDMEEAK